MDRTIISINKTNRVSGLWGTGITPLQSAQDAATGAALNKAAELSSDDGDGDGGGSGIWGSIFSNAGSWISSIGGSIAQIVQAKNGNYPTTTYQQDNTPKILAIAGFGAIVLVIILVVIFKNK